MNGYYRVSDRVYSKEDRAEVTLGNLIKIPPNLLLDMSPITSATPDIRIASFLSHANVFCQTYSHSIHFGAETSHSLSTLQQYILVSL